VLGGGEHWCYLAVMVDQFRGYVEHYNNIRLNSAIGYITPKNMLVGHREETQADRDRKLEAAREQRKDRRQRPRDG
jgi:hypothetical protein